MCRVGSTVSWHGYPSPNGHTGNPFADRLNVQKEVLLMIHCCIINSVDEIHTIDNIRNINTTTIITVLQYYRFSDNNNRYSGFTSSKDNWVQNEQKANTGHITSCETQ